MKKAPRTSVDGFVPRRPEAIVGKSSQTLGKSGIELGKVHEATSIRRSSRQGSNTDLHQSLMAIDDEPEIAPKKRRFFRRKRTKAPLTKRRKILKRIKWILLILIVVSVGYFGWKFISTSGKIFGGNPFGFIQHDRLKEDANGRTNILIFGTSGWSMNQANGWDGAFLTDSIMVLSVDQDTQEGYSVSLPRDLYVEHTCSNTLGTTSGKLNETFYCAYNDSNKSDKAGAGALSKTAGDILGLDVQYYVHANWTALQQGVDAVGGVDVKIESTDPRGVYDVATKINYKNGETVHLSGERALALARARNSEGGYGLSGGNFDREKNQQKLLVALQKKSMSAGTLANPAAVSGLVDALGDNLRTNFKTSEIQSLIDVAKNTDKVKSLPLVGREGETDLVTTGMLNGASIVQPTAGLYNYSDIRAYVAISMRGERTATIEVLNGSSTPGLAKNKASELEAAGYIVSKIENAPAEIKDTVRIYQLNDSKDTVAKSLEKKYSVTVTKGKLAGYNSGDDTDFIIVFGN